MHVGLPWLLRCVFDTPAIGGVRAGILARSMSIGKPESVDLARPVASNVDLVPTRRTWKSKIETEQLVHARS
ncbi:MAG TPA: hypothetical protein VLS88_01570 [Polyangiales bacterium]|nr:hypothetical protein [Polyangiales bacterium]